MKLKMIYEGRFRTAAIFLGEGTGNCEVIDYLERPPRIHIPAVQRLDVLLRRYARGGRQLLNDEQFHELDADHRIWELVAGQLRLMCFVSAVDGRLVLLNHCRVMPSQRTPRKDVTEAIEKCNACAGLVIDPPPRPPRLIRHILM